MYLYAQLICVTTWNDLRKLIFTVFTGIVTSDSRSVRGIIIIAIQIIQHFNVLHLTLCVITTEAYFVVYNQHRLSLVPTYVKFYC